MGLSLLQLNVSRQTSTHLLAADVLVRFRLLVNSKVSCSDRSLPLVIHGFGVTG